MSLPGEVHQFSEKICLSPCPGSTKTNLRDILPRTGSRFSFSYDHDFGDGCQQQVQLLFEGKEAGNPGEEYPLCTQGGMSLSAG